MIEKIGHIKNPLTVIAIFAGIAEISGTIILPFIAPTNQSTYIWFLMLFPFFLVSVFFLTLNYNHKTLYSPSDYKDESNFVNPIAKATPEESGKKLKQEAKEIEEEVKTERTDEDNNRSVTSEPESQVRTEVRAIELTGSSTTQSNTSSGGEASPVLEDVDAQVSAHNLSNTFVANLALAEKLAVAELSKELPLQFRPDTRIELPSYTSEVFSALATWGRTVHAVQVKMFAGNRIDADRLTSIIKKAKETQRNLISSGAYDLFILHIFAVTDASDAEIKKLRDSVAVTAFNYGVNIKLHTASLNDLMNLYQFS